MHRLITPAALVLIVAGWTAGRPVAARAESPRPAARAFSVRTLDGRTVRLSDLRGRPVILEFWASWSAPSRASMPVLSAMQGRYGGKGLVILGLSVDDGPPQRILGIAARMRLLYPVAMASEGILDDYGPIRSLPTTIFIDRRGRIARRVVGFVDVETLEGFIREIL